MHAGTHFLAFLSFYTYCVEKVSSSSSATVDMGPARDTVTIPSLLAGLCSVGSRRLIMSREIITTDNLCRGHQDKQGNCSSDQ